MILDRPLETVTTEALWAFHHAVSLKKGLVGGQPYDDEGNGCAITAMTDFVNKNPKLYPEHDYQVTRAMIMPVMGMNDEFVGTPFERRNFMLKGFEGELDARSEPVKRLCP